MQYTLSFQRYLDACEQGGMDVVRNRERLAKIYLAAMYLDEADQATLEYALHLVALRPDSDG